MRDIRRFGCGVEEGSTLVPTTTNVAACVAPMMAGSMEKGRYEGKIVGCC